jgi:hypothetical protein
MLYPTGQEIVSLPLKERCHRVRFGGFAGLIVRYVLAARGLQENVLRLSPDIFLDCEVFISLSSFDNN